MLFSGLTFLMSALVASLSGAAVPAAVPYVTVATHGVATVMPSDGQVEPDVAQGLDAVKKGDGETLG